MSKYIKNILAGMRRALVLAPEGAYQRPSRSDFSNDVKALSQDSKNIMRDLNKATGKCGK